MPVKRDTVCTVDDCDRKHCARGLCSMHYQRAAHPGTLPPPDTSPTRADEFSAFIAIETDNCTLWPYVATPLHYGLVRYEGRTHRAHALSCSLSHGPRPAGHDAAHSCGVRACINPRHLRWATRMENMADTIQHGTRMYGEKNPNAQLTDAQVVELRRLADEGLTTVELGIRFRVPTESARQIVRGDRWAHLAGARPHGPLAPRAYPVGESNHRRKLTNQQVIEIRQLSVAGVAQRVIAGQFGVQREAISKIVLGKRWQHLLTDAGRVTAERAVA